MAEKRVDYRNIYKKHYGINFDRKYAVHHIDGDRNNNKIDNLLLLPTELHARYHFYKTFVESAPVPTKITGNHINANNHYITCLEIFLKVLDECNKWYDYKIYLDGVIPNIHNIKLEG